jgi:Asp-tRNA(Asn)/Glu-tRNA(Gln) amidotransferase A subunit family amidase
MRSPYGQPASVFSSDYVSGGSSSGSCVSVASNQVSFSLATDTAGSGRVPASFNNIIGFKPTRGTVSLHICKRTTRKLKSYSQIPAAGVVPCCLSLDCIAIEASKVADARTVWRTLFKIDETEAFSKVSRPPWALAPRAILQPGEGFKFAIPPVDSESRKLVTTEFNQLFEAAVLLVKTIGGQLVDNVRYTVFEDAGRLLYEGSFVAERVSGVREWYDAHPAPTEPDVKDALLPEIRAIYSAAANNFSAADAWSDTLKMMSSQRLAQVEYGKMNVLVVPTAPMHPTKAQYLANPIALNHKLGKVRFPLVSYRGSHLATCQADASTLLNFSLRTMPIFSISRGSHVRPDLLKMGCLSQSRSLGQASPTVWCSRLPSDSKLLFMNRQALTEKVLLSVDSWTSRSHLIVPRRQPRIEC